MPLVIEDPETVATIQRLAKDSRRSIEDVLREAVGAADEERRSRDLRIAERMAALRDIQARFDRMPKSGLTADKAFFDEIGGNL